MAKEALTLLNLGPRKLLLGARDLLRNRLGNGGELDAILERGRHGDLGCVSRDWIGLGGTYVWEVGNKEKKCARVQGGGEGGRLGKSTPGKNLLPAVHVAAVKKITCWLVAVKSTIRSRGRTAPLYLLYFMMD